MKNSKKSQNFIQFSEDKNIQNNSNQYETNQIVSRKVSHQVNLQQSGQNKDKNVIIVTEPQKLFHYINHPTSANNTLQSARSNLNQHKTKNMVKPRFLSPKAQGDVIDYLQKLNEELIKEGKQKQQIINHLLGNKQHSPSEKYLLPYKTPRSADSKKPLLSARLPIIKTFEQNQHMLESKPTNQSNQNVNMFNLSFGEQKEPPPQQKEPHQHVRSHFSKLLLKLPQEFHLLFI